jgi:hypothetical protein
LDKVVIVSQGGGDALSLHDLEAGAVGEAPVFVGTSFVAIKGDCKLLRRLWNYDHGIALVKPWTAVATARRSLGLPLLKLFKSSTKTISLVTNGTAESWRDRTTAF